MAHELPERFRTAQVIPVVRTRTAKAAATAVAWLRDAGLRVFEVTMTLPDASTAAECLKAWAKFVVAPWVDPTLAAPCHAADAALLLGAITPSAVRAALAAGADAVRIFPAASVGRPGHIKALVSVFPDVAFRRTCEASEDRGLRS
jgi:2-dehydro-3-deoxyphosphogluconate aldolase / (4S)-4-hydroxy-2-oxoglutarate aldolase